MNSTTQYILATFLILSLSMITVLGIAIHSRLIENNDRLMKIIEELTLLRTGGVSFEPPRRGR